MNKSLNDDDNEKDNVPYIKNWPDTFQSHNSFSLSLEVIRLYAGDYVLIYKVMLRFWLSSNDKYINDAYVDECLWMTEESEESQEWGITL